MLVFPAAGAAATTTSAEGMALSTTGAMTLTACDGFVNAGAVCATAPNRAGARQLNMAWTGAGTLHVPIAVGAIAPTVRLSVRLAVNHSSRPAPPARSSCSTSCCKTPAARAAVALEGRGIALRPAIGTTQREVLLDAVRIPAAEFAAQGIDLAHVQAIEVVAGRSATGSVQLAELAVSAAPVAGDIVGQTPTATVPELGSPGLAAAAAAVLGGIALATGSRRRS